MRVLKAGCQQQPQPGARLGISGSVFSSTPIVSTSSSASPSTTPNPSGQWGLSAGAKVGIGLGVPAALLIILLLFGCWYQRKRDLRKRHHGMNERWGDKSITSPVPGWTQYRPDPERPMPQNESPHDYDQAQYASDMPKHGNGGGHHEKLVLQEIPLPRHKSPPPAMTVDTRNVPRGHGWEDPSPQSLFG
ncbi:MAG: hypothetical protein M1830_005293 [Pleopsidium flavum]|nr:MAG: hypothetical protein M1830_005293 [Pleopsidium flavum]